MKRMGVVTHHKDQMKPSIGWKIEGKISSRRRKKLGDYKVELSGSKVEMRTKCSFNLMKNVGEAQIPFGTWRIIMVL
jgi:hypothetical protein